MKIIRAFLLLPIIAFVACETTHPDGSVTRFDAEGATEGIRAAGEVVNQYQRAQQQYRNYSAPASQQPIYSPYGGQAIYPVTP